MRNKLYTCFCAAVVTASLLSVGACTNEETPVGETAGSPVPLELTVSGIGTRAVIDGTALPDPCSYGVFVIGAGGQEVATNVRVDYENGVSTPVAPIYLPQPNMDYQVMAYYPYEENQPYVESVTWGSIENQTDCLYVNPVTVGQDYPKASLHFRHALTRVTLRIRKDASNTNDYHLTGAGIANSFDAAYFDLRNAEFVKQSGFASPFAAVDSDLSQECVADVLVFPMDLNAVSQDVGLMLWFADGQQAYAQIPRTVWEMGQQYTYEVVVNDAGAISVGEAVITPWENNEEPGITVGNDNYVE